MGAVDLSKKTTSFQTVASLVNQMVGGTVLVLPILFLRNGIIMGALNMVISGLISGKTNMIYAEHLKLREKDFQFSIKRILGNNYEMLYKITKWCYLVLLLLTYFILINQQLYQVGIFIIAASGSNAYVDTSQEGVNQFVFNVFSPAWMTIIVFFMCLYMVFMKDFVLLVKLAGFGILSIVGFSCFILYLFFTAVSKPNFIESHKGMPLFTWDLGKLAGTAALAFTNHVNSGPVIKCNEDQNKNQRDVGLSYLFGGTIYVMIGVLGSISIFGTSCKYEVVGTLTQCFNGAESVPNLIVVLIYVGHLISVFPIYFNILRLSFFILFFRNENPSDKQIAVVNIIFLILCSIIVNIPGLQVEDVMSLNGSVCCFFFVYWIPIALDMTCYHGNNKILNVLRKTLSQIGIINDKVDGHSHHSKSKFSNQSLKIGTDVQDNQCPKCHHISGKNVYDDNNHLNECLLAKQQQQQQKQQQQTDSKLKNQLNKSNIKLSINEQQAQNQQIYNESESENEVKVQYIGTDTQQKTNQKSQIKQFKVKEEENKEEEQEDQEDETKSEDINNILQQRHDSRYFSTCSYHENQDSVGKNSKVIFYTVIGIIGLSILLYEIYTLIYQAIESF